MMDLEDFHRRYFEQRRRHELYKYLGVMFLLPLGFIGFKLAKHYRANAVRHESVLAAPMLPAPMDEGSPRDSDQDSVIKPPAARPPAIKPAPRFEKKVAPKTASKPTAPGKTVAAKPKANTKQIAKVAARPKKAIRAAKLVKK